MKHCKNKIYLNHQANSTNRKFAHVFVPEIKCTMTQEIIGCHI